MPRFFLILLTLLGVTFPGLADAPSAPKKQNDDDEIVLPKGVPAKVARVLKHIDETGEAPKNYVGGRHFGNFEGQLPKRDKKGKTIKYQEWDVNPKIPGKNRGAERLITGSDGSAHYTADHYKSFKKIR